MKKLLSVLISLSLLLAMLPMSTFVLVASGATSGYCGGEGDGTNLSWTLEDGVLTISGVGKMRDGRADWGMDVKEVYISPGVTSIGENAFYACDFTEVVIPEGIESIGKAAFNSCINLKNIKLPSTISFIGSAAFDLKPIESITVSNENPYYKSLNNCLIDKRTNAIVLGCKNSVIPADPSVTTIAAYAFRYVGTISNISIPKNIRTIEKAAFDGASFSNVNIEDLAAWCSMDFQDTPISTTTKVTLNGNLITNLTIPGSIKVVNRRAFANCRTIKTLTISEGVTTLEGGAFLDCDMLSSVSLPNSLKTIGSSVFSSCWQLTNINIPSSVTSIGKNCFANCSRLTSVTLGNGITELPDTLFDACRALTSVSLPNNLKSIGMGVFWSCEALQEIEIPSTVTSMGKGTFYNCKSLKQVKIPDGVPVIKESSFYNCEALESVDIGKDVLEIEKYAFSNCKNLSTVTGGENVTSIGLNVFTDTKWHKNPPGGVFYLGKVLYKCSGEYPTKISIKPGTTQIYSNAFEGCSNIIEIFIPGSVQDLGSSLFKGCTNLQKVNIPYGIETIYMGLFMDCTSLQVLELPITLTKMFSDLSINMRSPSFKYQGSQSDKAKIFFDEPSRMFKNSSNWYYNQKISTGPALPQGNPSNSATNSTVNVSSEEAVSSEESVSNESGTESQESNLADNSSQAQSGSPNNDSNSTPIETYVLYSLAGLLAVGLIATAVVFIVKRKQK